VKELSDEDVSLNDVFLIDVLHRAQNVQQPFELLLTGGHPDEIHLNTSPCAQWLSG